MMWVILVSLLAGAIAGIFIPLKEKHEKQLSQLQLYCLYLIILLMGLKIGIDPRIFGYMGKLGIQALVLAFSAVLGSVVFSFWSVKLLTALKRREKGSDLKDIDIFSAGDRAGKMDTSEEPHLLS